MSLVFSCITPHTPLLMPTIGKDEGLAALAKTRAAMAQLEQDLYLAQPETIMVLSPHGDVVPDAVSINMHGSYAANFEEFGDLLTKRSWKSDVRLIDHIREDFKAKGLPLTLNSAEHLDYGTAVPLCALTGHLPNARIIPVVTSHLSAKEHFDIGRELKDEIMRSTKRIAVIGSADLSHRVGENSPAGLSPRGVAFDEKVLEMVAKHQHLGILDIDAEWEREAHACGTRVLAMMCGLMEEIRHTPTVLSYEKPFGVGYAVVRMALA